MRTELRSIASAMVVLVSLAIAPDASAYSGYKEPFFVMFTPSAVSYLQSVRVTEKQVVDNTYANGRMFIPHIYITPAGGGSNGWSYGYMGECCTTRQQIDDMIGFVQSYRNYFHDVKEWIIYSGNTGNGNYWYKDSRGTYVIMTLSIFDGAFRGSDAVEIWMHEHGHQYNLEGDNTPTGCWNAAPAASWTAADYLFAYTYTWNPDDIHFSADQWQYVDSLADPLDIQTNSNNRIVYGLSAAYRTQNPYCATQGY